MIKFLTVVGWFISKTGCASLLDMTASPFTHLAIVALTPGNHGAPGIGKDRGAPGHRERSFRTKSEFSDLLNLRGPAKIERVSD
jgi:hypothetical protein